MDDVEEVELFDVLETVSFGDGAFLPNIENKLFFCTFFVLVEEELFFFGDSLGINVPSATAAFLSSSHNFLSSSDKAKYLALPSATPSVAFHISPYAKSKSDAGAI